MSLTVGSEVAVLSLGRKRGEVVGKLRDGVYRIRVGTVLVTCAARDIEPIAARRRKRPRPVPPPDATATPTGEGPPADTERLSSVDLHGLGVDEARNRVAGHISRAIVAGLDRVEIVHGIGTGALRRAIVADLGKIAAVTRVRPHPSNPGVTIVYF